MERPVLILCPLAIEQRAARKAIGDRARIVTIGPGSAAVRNALASGDLNTETLLVLFGVAGGLAECPAAPSINEIIDDATGDRWTPTHRLPSADSAGVSLVGVEHPVTSPAEKQVLRAHTGAALVDTESHAIARHCAERNLSWAVVRGVSDGPHDTLPSQAVNWINHAGRTRPTKVGADLVRSPALAPRLVHLARSTHRALAAASIQLRTLLDQPADTMAPHEP